MSDEIYSCSKCDGEMVRGFSPDLTYGGVLVARWFEGVPEKSFWTGTKTRSEAGTPIAAFRCSKCGYLEFFADDRFTPE